MTALSPLVPSGNAIIETTKARYTTKSYDSSRRISDEHVQAIRDLLRYSASSTNAQPWHFILAGTEAGKERVAKATEGAYTFNRSKVIDASHVVVFAARTNIDEAFLQRILEAEDADGRFAADPETLKPQTHAVRSMFVDLHKNAGDLEAWTQAQTYLNIGQFLLGVAALGIDATPMEGVDLEALDAEFGLREKGLRSLVVVSLGYRAPDDFNAQLAKSRLPEAEVITEI